MIGEVLPFMLNKGMQNPSSDVRKIRCVILEECDPFCQAKRFFARFAYLESLIVCDSARTLF